MSEPTLAQRLGYAADAKLLIINADDLGSCHSANVGRLRVPGHGDRHQRHADGAVPVGPRGVEPLPGRGHRGPPDRQRRVRALPLGPDHPRPVAAGRRRRVPEDDGGRLGPRRPRRGAPGVPGPDRAGHPVGLRRQPPRRPHGHPAAPARVLRRLPGHGHRVRAAAAHDRRRAWSATSGSPAGPWPPRRAPSSPITPASSPASGPARPSRRIWPPCGPASPRCTCTRRSTAPSCGRWPPTTGRPGSTTTA